jgi:hypothetical protein
MIQNDAGKADVFDHGRSRHSELVRPSSVLSSAAAQLLQKQSGRRYAGAQQIIDFYIPSFLK